jgi:predicted nucleic acid-binding protein
MTSDSRAFLVDTNVLVYVYDPVDPIKQVRALDVLDRLAASGAGCLTTQVLGEFFLYRHAKAQASDPDR